MAHNLVLPKEVTLPVVKDVDWSNGLVHLSKMRFTVETEVFKDAHRLYHKAYVLGSPKDRMAYETRFNELLRCLLDAHFDYYEYFKEMNIKRKYTYKELMNTN